MTGTRHTFSCLLQEKLDKRSEKQERSEKLERLLRQVLQVCVIDLPVSLILFALVTHSARVHAHLTSRIRHRRVVRIG